MWLLVDVFLGSITVLHFFMMCSIATPVDSPLKQPLVKFMTALVTPLEKTPLLRISALTVLMSICIVTALGEAWLDTTMRTRFCAAFFTLLSSPVYMKLGHLTVALGSKRILDWELEVASQDILDWVPPKLSSMEPFLAPLQSLLRVECVGLDRVPRDYPCFYVMNHSLMGLEMPSFLYTLYKETGIWVRGLADHFHWAGPHGPFFRFIGAVDGTRPNVDLLMRHKQNVLVYPGGGNEILKPATVERYSLMWKERLGFARMAIKNRYPILPCACVGTEDMLDIMADLPTGFLKGPTGVASLPLVKPNSLQKVYFWFGEPIHTSQYNGDAENNDYAMEVRDKTKAAVEQGIKELKEKQATDPDRFIIASVGQQIREAQKKSLDSLKTMLGSIKTE